METGERITRALEAIEDGDIAYAVELLLGYFEHSEPHVVRCHCRMCGAGFEWPGLLARHLDVTGHDFELEEIAA